MPRAFLRPAARTVHSRIGAVVAGDHEGEERLDVRLVVELRVAKDLLDGPQVPIEIVPLHGGRRHCASRVHETTTGALTYPAATETASAAASDGWNAVMGRP
jgi:hypothetical protein